MLKNSIAIIGMSCLLPKSNTPAALWNNIIENRDCLSEATVENWRVNDPSLFLLPSKAEPHDLSDKVNSLRGGYIEHFSTLFNPNHFNTNILNFNLDFSKLDPVFLWTLYTAHQALLDAKLANTNAQTQDIHPQKSGLILGNLSYPSSRLSQLCEQLWLQHQSDPKWSGLNTTTVAPINRFMSGLPAQLAAQLLGISGCAFAIDAACASGLYAIKLACDRLLKYEMDLMLAGAVNAADDLFIHMGFTVLQALSTTGQSRPFHKAANGLVPAQGAAFLVLKRLEDAVRDHNHIYAIIRGVGLSNDGKTNGFLAPSSVGQVRALQKAYKMSGLFPDDIDWVECHATGTMLGDQIELATLKKIFGAQKHLFVSALKSNIGHTITTSGIAGIIKIIEAIKNKIIPPTRIQEEIKHYIVTPPFELAREPVAWDKKNGIYRAAINSFGFGGCNAHALLESWEEQNLNQQFYINKSIPEPIVITGIAIHANHLADKKSFLEYILNHKNFNTELIQNATDKISLSYAEARFPPRDLQQTLGQQLIILKLVAAALADLSANFKLPSHTTGVYMGMQCDTDIARYGLRWRLRDLFKNHNIQFSEKEIHAYLNSVHPPLTAAYAIGAMPNVVANRVSMQYNCEGPGFTFSAENLSGIYALQQAIYDLQDGEIDMAIVGAVDLAGDFINKTVFSEFFSPPQQAAVDAAVVLILEKLSDAKKNNHKIYACVNDCNNNFNSTLTPKIFQEDEITQAIGYAPAAQGLLTLATAALCTYYKVWPGKDENIAFPHSTKEGNDLTQVICKTQWGQCNTLMIEAISNDALDSYVNLPSLYIFEREQLSLFFDKPLPENIANSARLVIIATNEKILETRIQLAKSLLANFPPHLHLPAQGIHYQSIPVKGEIASVFTAAHTSYYGMGREVVLAFPQIRQALTKIFPFDAKIFESLYKTLPQYQWSFLDELIFYSYLSQFHYYIVTKILKINPNAMIGYCSGETNALFASGAWKDLLVMLKNIEESDIYTQYLAGAYKVLENNFSKNWRVYHILENVEKIKKLILNFPNCYLTIINTENDAVVAGLEEELTVLLKNFAPEQIKLLTYHMIIHCPLVEKINAIWHEVHNRKTANIKPLRLYSSASGKAYFPNQETAADALLAQATHQVNFPKVIQEAWNDGVRIFIEHGPKNLCTRAIQEILKDKPHLAISFDHAQNNSLQQFASVAAALISNQVQVDYANVIYDFKSKIESEKNSEYPLHWSPVQFNSSLPDPDKVKPISNNPPNVTIINNFYQKFAKNYQEFLKNYKYAFENILTMVKATAANNNHDFSSEKFIMPTTFSRKDLEMHATGQISKIFGPLFQQQDSYLFQVRMPEPPLLLADRVTRIEGEAGKMGLGKVWTETDVTHDAWYLQNLHMPAGIMIEAGQADLFLISWLGIDFINRGQRVYRLLGCELTYEGGLPQIGDTLHYEIEVDSHATEGDVQLFFFHYDCTINDKIRLKVREGQAGFFSYEALKNSKGILWDPHQAIYRENVKWDPPIATCQKKSFNGDDLKNFSNAKVYECFGAGYELTATHSQSPSIVKNKMLLIDSVEIFDPNGGSWKRGYCRAHLNLTPEHWFFKGHFKNDPCMPGTLMFEGGLQVMAFYMTALGYTLKKDGWRFEPIPGIPYKLRCRGQATPHSKYITYELFIEEQIAEPTPQLIADLLVSVDGFKAFHARGLGLQLTLDYPLSRHLELPQAVNKPPPYDPAAMLAFAWGKPSLALGKLYASFDAGRLVARMPGPPYNFMHDVVHLFGEENSMQSGASVIISYEVPMQAWYFENVPENKMPFCILLEIALQPCGWLASYMGCTLHSTKTLCFRNLDGKARIIEWPRAGSGIIYTQVKLTKLSQYMDTFILNFEVQCELNQKIIFTTETSFGFFPVEAFLNQPGLAVTAEEKLLLGKSSEVVFDKNNSHYFSPNKMLNMLDKITGYWRNPTSNIVAQLCAEKIVDPNDWFFKAHFYLDPVQPGSLGLQAMIELLQFYLWQEYKNNSKGDPLSNFNFLNAALMNNIEWKYRGQVTPLNKMITIVMTVTKVKTIEMNNKNSSQIIGYANAILLVDGKKIYAVNNLEAAISVNQPES